jgi:hypothetical protein
VGGSGTGVRVRKSNALRALILFYYSTWWKTNSSKTSCGPALTAHGSLDLKQEIQIQRQAFWHWTILISTYVHCCVLKF